MTTEPCGSCERSDARLGPAMRGRAAAPPAPSHHGGSALGAWLRLCGWFGLIGLLAMGSSIVLTELGLTSELALWTMLTMASVACWLGLRRPVRYPPRTRWRLSWFEAGAIAVVIVVGAALLLRGSATSVALVSVVTLLLAAFTEEFIFRWVPFDLIRRLRGRTWWHVSVSVASAVLFLSLHEMAHPALVVDRLVFSLMSYWLCVYSGAMWLSWTAHVLTNAMAMALLGASPSTNGYWLFLGLSTLIVAAMLLASRRMMTRPGDSGGIEARVTKGVVNDGD